MLLCIDTASAMCSVALSDGVRVHAHATLHTHRGHAMHMHPTIARLCTEAGVMPEQWTGIAVGCGPGSYTGVRLAIATAKTMAWVRKLPVYTVSSLEAMAYAAWRAYSGHDAVVIPVIDGRRGRAYSASFIGTADAWTRIDDDRLRLWEDVWQLAQGRGPRIYATDGSAGQCPERVHVCAPEAWAIAALVALGHAQRHEDVHAIVPNYTQATEAEATWTEHHTDAYDA